MQFFRSTFVHRVSLYYKISCNEYCYIINLLHNESANEYGLYY
jgi:hypothetical protein